MFHSYHYRKYKVHKICMREKFKEISRLSTGNVKFERYPRLPQVELDCPKT